MENEKKFKSIIDEMYDTYQRKNKDYGSSFSESVEEFGPISGVVRLSDKFNRLKTLLKNNKIPEVKDESIIDTLTDMACYAIMLRMELEKEKTNMKVKMSEYIITPKNGQLPPANELYETLRNLDLYGSLRIVGTEESGKLKVIMSDSRIESLKYLIKHFNFH